MSRQISARIVNADDMARMFGDVERLKNTDFQFRWHNFPTTKEEMQVTLRGIGIDVIDPAAFVMDNFDTTIYELNEMLPRFASLDELNYLAVKMDGMTQYQQDIFRAVVETGRHCETLKDIINLTENLDYFDLQPAFSAEMYGDFLAQMNRDYFANAIESLEKSDDPVMRELAVHIDKLDDHLNAESYGREIAKEENGIFAEAGYLTEDVGGYQEVYRGPEDIPAEYRVSVLPEPVAKEKPSVMDKLAAAKESVKARDAEKPPVSPGKSHDAEL